MKSLIYAALFACLSVVSVAARAQQQGTANPGLPDPPKGTEKAASSAFKEVAGAFSHASGSYSRRLYLTEDGRYELKVASQTLRPDDEAGVSRGRCEMKEGCVVLTPGGDSQSGRLLKAPLRFIPARWGERLYMVLDTEMERFLWAVRAGEEPVAKSSPTFLLRWGDELKPAPGLPTLPKPWADLLKGVDPLPAWGPPAGPFYAVKLMQLAEKRLKEGKLAESTRFAREALKRNVKGPLSFDEEALRHNAYQTLGRVALREGKKVDALRLLDAAGGAITQRATLILPDLRLASELLTRGETEAVTHYLKLMKKALSSEKVEGWIQEIHKGKAPKLSGE